MANRMDNRVYIRGSWGTLTVDRTSGLVLTYDHEGNAIPDPTTGDNGYDDYRLIDVELFRREPRRADFDILEAAFVTADGHYEPALTPRLWHDRDGCPDVDLWVPYALLSAA